MARLIDIDALRDYWRISEPCERCHWNKIDCSKPPYYSLLDICNAIDEMPTIDAIPVEWLREKMQKPQMTCANPFGYVLAEWLEEQGAR